MARTFINPELEEMYREVGPRVLKRLRIASYKYPYTKNLTLQVLQLKPFFSEDYISFHCNDIRDDAKDIETFNRL